jgi:iron complex outermembrane recepter protein
LEFKITTYTATLNWRHRWHQNLIGDIGINGMSQENTVSGRIFIPNFTNNVVGAYWTEQIRLGKCTVEAGMRYDVRKLNAFFYKNDVIETPSYQFHNYAASLGTSAALSEKSTWNIMLSRTFRAPAVNELFSQGLHHGAAAIESGNANLAPEKAYNLSTGYKLSASRWSGEVNGYVNYIEDFIYLKPVQPPVLTIQGAFPAFAYEQTNAFLYGGDLSLAYALSKKTSAELKFSTLSGRDLNQQTDLIYMPPTRVEPALSYRFKNSGHLKEATFILSGTLVFRKENAPDDVDYLPPPAGYGLLHAQLHTKVKVAREWLTTGIKASNILNTVYRDYLDRFRYYHDAQGIAIQVFLKVPITINP